MIPPGPQLKVLVVVREREGRFLNDLEVVIDLLAKLLQQETNVADPKKNVI